MALGEVGGTHLRSVAWMGDRGLDGLVEQTLAVLNGEDPDLAKLGYRQAFEVVPVTPAAGKGRLMEIRVPSFHGDLLILQIRAAEGKTLAKKAAPAGVAWVDAPPSSRDVAVSADLLAHLDLARMADRPPSSPWASIPCCGAPCGPPCGCWG